MEQDFIKMMINDYDQLEKLPKEAYEKVLPNLRQVKLKRGTVIKEPGSADEVSRYLCKGFIGSFRIVDSGLKLFSIYRATDTVFDESSFRTRLPSESVLKSISDVIFFESTDEFDLSLVGSNALFSTLAQKLSYRITERNSRVYAIAKMGLEKGYGVLMKEFPSLEAQITNSDIASFFGVSTRTVERWKHNLKAIGS